MLLAKNFYTYVFTMGSAIFQCKFYHLTTEIEGDRILPLMDLQISINEDECIEIAYKVKTLPLINILRVQMLDGLLNNSKHLDIYNKFSFGGFNITMEIFPDLYIVIKDKDPNFGELIFELYNSKDSWDGGYGTNPIAHWDFYDNDLKSIISIGSEINTKIIEMKERFHSNE